MSERMMFAAWRVWAADIRDRKPPYGTASACAVARADTLADCLDAWQKWQVRARRPEVAANLCAGLEASIETLIAQILAEGIQPPAVLARIASR